MNQPYCRRCLGFGAVLGYRSQPQSNGQTLVIETNETCPTCQGRGTR
ncbi:hypothetical protein [Nonomuraea aurantiaca]|nr:hypothetical protein [Nonomuraea aurantiaca]MCA2223490.1 hypothetical protein [Nonomuraea aurantiaca]